MKIGGIFIACKIIIFFSLQLMKPMRPAKGEGVSSGKCPQGPGKIPEEHTE